MSANGLSFLRKGERVTLNLRGLYERNGYKKYRMSQFEEYDLYLSNKNFLKSRHIITFQDMDGRVLALKPDVTLSIAKNTRATPDNTERFYYIENVYRLDEASKAYKEINQLGLECIGRLGVSDYAEVVSLALQTLAQIDEHAVMQLSHIGFVLSLLDSLSIEQSQRHALIECIAGKNQGELLSVAGAMGVSGAAAKLLGSVISLSGPFTETLARARELAIAPGMNQALDQLAKLYEQIQGGDNLALDFSLISDIDYYSGIAFRGYVPGVARVVLAGGEYGNLLKKFGRELDAIGFAVYLNELDMAQTPEAEKPDMRQVLTVALPKGRLGDQVYEKFSKIGYDCSAIYDDNRKLVFENPERGVRYLLVKPSDVAIYVEHGAADLGVVGKDILADASPDVYELLDMGIGVCRLCVAARNGYVEDHDRVLRVATKFANAAKAYYASINREIEIIKLNGSIELAPILGLSDVIVDIVESGKTLVENDLSVINTIMPISARLIANKACYMFKRAQIEQIQRALGEAKDD